jgi:hypothetical protein
MEDTAKVDLERKHLEGLLKDRISFFLLFAPVLVAASYNIANLWIRGWVLLVGTLVSFLLSVAILRTHLFVELALKDILKDAEHPYTRYRKAVWFRLNANWLLLPIPFILTGMFGWLAAVAFGAYKAC